MDVSSGHTAGTISKEAVGKRKIDVIEWLHGGL
jgi:hypothetical protein